jgi:malate synthase
MEDAATAEISRTQLWQWIHHGARLDDGRVIDAAFYVRIRDEELSRFGGEPHVQTAAKLFDELILADELADILTIPAYQELLRQERS